MKFFKDNKAWMGEPEEVVRKDGKNRDCPPSTDLKLMLFYKYINLLIKLVSVE